MIAVAQSKIIALSKMIAVAQLKIIALSKMIAVAQSKMTKGSYMGMASLRMYINPTFLKV